MREKPKRFRTVEEMGSDGVEELRFIKANPAKFKLPRKVFREFNTVGPSYVPRKLRSAIKERTCESALPLPSSRALNHSVNGVEQLRNDCLKKSKISMQSSCLGHVPKRAKPIPISKEEKEVAETLFALAGMTPYEMHIKNKIDGKSLEAKALDLTEKPEDRMLEQDSMILKVEPKVTYDAASGQLTSATKMADRLAQDSDETKPMAGPTPLGSPTLSERRQINVNLEVSVPQVNLQAIPQLLRTCDQRPLINSNFFHTSTEPCQEAGLHKIEPQKALPSKNDSHTKNGVVDVIDGQDKHSAISIDRKGLTSRPLHASGADGHPLQSSAIILPSWLQTAAFSSRLRTSQDIETTQKVSSSIGGWWKSQKRCTLHIYISHLIQMLQMSEQKDIQASNANIFRPFQSLSGHHNSNPSNIARSEINGMLIASHASDSTAYTNDFAAANSIPESQKHQKEQEEGPSFSGCCVSKQQSFDFMSSSSEAGSAVSGGVNRWGNNLESGTKSPVLNLNLAAQQNTWLPFSLPQNLFYSNPCWDEVASASVGLPPLLPQVRLQANPYFDDPFASLHMGSMTAAQEAQPKQLQQQQNRSAQLAEGQFRPGPHLSSHITHWQNRRQDLHFLTRMQAVLLPSQQPPQVLGTKYLQISQQQPQLVALSPSLPLLRAKPKHGQLLSVCEDSAGQLHPDSIVPLQLLRNEQP